MGAVTKRAANSRREEILRAAAKMFASRGFHGVSIDDIGAAVGISGPGLYRHFASKEAMLAEMLIGISERLLAGGMERVEDVAGPREALDELVRFHVDFALDNPELITVHDRDLASLPENEQRRVRQLQRRYVEIWVEVIRGLLPEAGEDQARAAAHAVFGLLNSTPHSLRLDRAAMADLLHRMAIAALLTPGAVSGRPALTRAEGS